MSEPSGMPWRGDARPVQGDAQSSSHRYRVIDKLESGGMAEVFRAESSGLEGFRKQVAIKRVLPHLGRNAKFIEMFLDEARLSAQLSHSNCVQVFDIGVRDDAYFIVMEFVDGANLKSIATSLQDKGRTLPIPVAVHIAHEICKGLSYAHELTDRSGAPLGIVHRDVSPPNVLVTKHGEVKIVDFGLAKASSQIEPSEPGVIKGKFAYLSPEAALGEEVDCRTDIFAVGIILWELLAGKRLFTGESEVQIIHRVQAATIPALSRINRHAPPELERIVNRALARDRAERYATARELGQDLTRFLFQHAQPVSGYDIAAIVQETMREKENLRLAQGSFIHKLIEDALFEFRSLRSDRPTDPAPIAALLVAPSPPAPDEQLFVDSASPAGLPAVEHGNLAALEEGDAPAPRTWHRPAIAAALVLAATAAALAWLLA